MKRFGIWTCSELTNLHPVFHCCYNNAGKQYAAQTPAANLPVRAQGRGAENITSDTHKHSRVLCEQKKRAGDPLLPPCGHTKPSQLCSLLPCGCTSHLACYGHVVATPKRVCSLLCKIKNEPFIIYLKRKLHEKPRFYFLSTSLLPELQVICRAFESLMKIVQTVVIKELMAFFSFLSKLNFRLLQSPRHFSLSAYPRSDFWGCFE